MESWILGGHVFLRRRTREPVELKLDPHFRLPIPNRRGEEREEAEQNVGFQLHPHKKPFFSPSPSPAATASSEYGPPARAQQQQQQQRSYSRLAGMRSGGGEIVEVQGGHIVRSIGRKDRHSKVCTAKGPRDRRVRLSAHTAIQFYDVQDRLGYDRPSKAVDWLIKNAKAAIDELSELPAWHPSSVHEISNKKQTPPNEPIDQQMQQGLIPELSSVGYLSGSRSFSGFRFPAGIHGEDVLDDGISEKPSSDSSASHY